MHARAVALTLAMMVVGALPLPVADASPAIVSLDLVELCLPQFGSCAAPPGCAGFVAPGGHVGLSLRAMKDGAPAPYEKVHIEPDGESVWTNGEGIARVSLPPREGVETFTFNVGGEQAHALTFAWGGLTGRALSVPQNGWVDVPTAVAVEVRHAITDAPVEGARLIVRPSVGHATWTAATDADGRTTAKILHHEAARVTYTLPAAVFCNLPLIDSSPFSLNWRAPVAPEFPPQLRLAVKDWSSRVDVLVDDGAPPYDVRWRLDGAAWRALPVVLPEGVHVLEAQASDANGRLSNLARQEVRVDVSPPTVTPTWQEVAWPSCSGFSWRVEDVGSGPAWSSGRLLASGRHVPLQVADGALRASLPDGVHGLSLTVRDHAGNVASWSGEVRCDGVAPSIVFDPGDEWGPCTRRVAFVSDAASMVRPDSLAASVAGSHLASEMDAGIVRVTLPEGAHVVHLQVTDNAGHIAEASRTLRCDATPPVVSVSVEGARASDWLVEPGRIVVAASDALSGVDSVRVRVDGGEWVAVEAAPAMVGEGRRLVEVEAVDVVGHRVTAPLEVFVDTVAPRIEAPPWLRGIEGEALLVRVEERGSGVERMRLSFGSVHVEGVAEGDGVFALRVPAGVSPESVLLVSARDKAGHVETVQVRVEAAAVVEAPDRVPPPVEVKPSEDPDAPLVMRVQSVIVTPGEGSVHERVRITGSAEGVRGGRAVLVDEAGAESLLGEVHVENGQFRVEGLAPASGRYVVWLHFDADDGSELRHEAGEVFLKGAEPAKTPGLGVALLGVAVLVGFVWSGRRRRSG